MNRERPWAQLSFCPPLSSVTFQKWESTTLDKSRFFPPEANVPAVFLCRDFLCRQMECWIESSSHTPPSALRK